MNAAITSFVFTLGMVLGLSACTDPYDPGQRAIGGGLFDTGTGAAIGGIAGGGRGAATGALLVEHWVPSVGLRLRPATTDAVTTALAMAPAMTALATMGPATTATAIRGSDVTRACVGATHNLKILAGAVAALLITGSVVPLPAHAQSAPAGSYRGSCTDVRVEDRTLTAVCRIADGREQRTTLTDLNRCVGDIGNDNGMLTCNHGEPMAPFHEDHK
jgi:hypothetical protein